MRGRKYAVDELKTKVDEHYPKIEAVDSTLINMGILLFLS